MDINDLRGLATLLTFVAFVSVCVWAYSSKRKGRFEEAANLPFADEEDATDHHSAMQANREGKSS